MNSSPSRILFLEALATISGGQVVLLNMISRFRENYDLSVLLPGDGPFALELQKLGVDCHFVSMGFYSLVRKSFWDLVNYTIRLPWLTFFTWQLIRQQQIDLVYANSPRTFVWGTLAATLAGRPVIWHHHNLLADGKTLTLLKIVSRFPLVRRIFCVSEAARRQFSGLAHKTVLVRTGVDTEHFRPDTSAGLAIRQEWAISAEEKVVGIIGDLIQLKGQCTLLEAVPLVSSDVHYLVVGQTRSDDADSRQYAAQIGQMAPKHVFFTGYRRDIPAILNALDLLVIASERETGPLVLLEALACGVPVISTPVGWAPELLPGEALFPVGDQVALADRLKFWLDDPHRLQAAKAAARALAEEELSIQRFHTQIEAEIDTTLAESPRKSLSVWL